MSNDHKYTPDPRGLYRKYDVFEVGEDGLTGNLVTGFVFVLRGDDPHARSAMMQYAASVRIENPQLAAELEAYVTSREEEPATDQPQGEPQTKIQELEGLWSQVYARQRQIRLYVKEIELLMLKIAGLDVEIDEPATDQSVGGSE